MVTRISGVLEDDSSDDWIAEGLAEWYSVELMFRAGAMNRERRQQIMSRLSKRGEDVTFLRQARSTGAVTARAVVLFDELDQEIRLRTNNQHDLDDVVRALIPVRKVALDDLRQAAENLVGDTVTTLQTPLLKTP
jgi:predicted metalloprotease with PDZ domain